MKLSLAFLSIVLTSCTVFAAPSPASYEIFERIHEIPEGYSQLDLPVDLSKKVLLRFHVKQQNFQQLERRLLEISNPDHPSYGYHLSKDEVNTLTRPSSKAVNAVVGWLKSFPFVSDKNIDVAHSNIKLNTNLEQAQQLLHANYKLYRDDWSPGNPVIARTVAYSLPKNIHQYVDMVSPTTMFGMRALGSHVHKLEKSPSLFQAVRMSSDFNVTACNQTITPDCLSYIYGFNGYNGPSKKNKHFKQGYLGVTGYLNQVAQYPDMDIFLKAYAPDKVGTNFTMESINSGNLTHDPLDLNGYAEANLDIQYALSISARAGIPNVFYSTGGSPPFIPDLDVTENNSEPYLEWLEWMLDQDHLPDTVTTSYGESEQTVPLSYRLRVCNQMAILAIRGVSLLFSSGDCGPGWSCKSNDGKNTTKFLPQFPASCPWVTAVGGTVNIQPERAVDFSAGGFSDTWSMPLYQAHAVSSFFANNPTAWKPFYHPQKLFNRFGRGYPDIAAQGSNFHIILNGKDYKIGGTSASAPAAAAIIALLNNELRSRGRRPLGFLNPWLYSHRISKLMTDVVDGTSEGCNGKRWGKPIAGDPHLVPNAGWKAVKGWDASTGLGTLNFDKLLKVL